MCVIDLTRAQRPCTTLVLTEPAERYTKRRGNFIELVIRYTQRPLIGFPLESKASRVKCNDRRGGTSVLVARNTPKPCRAKQIVCLSHGNRIYVVKVADALWVGKEKKKKKIFADENPSDF